MPTQKKHLVQLGIFITAGLLLLVLALFLIGKNQHLIGSHYQLKARFDNVSGLRNGNNVRYAGIDIGTVSKMDIINDTMLEITLLVKKDMQQVIRSNALVSLGNDGLMGNKVVNIVPQPGHAPYAADGALLASRKTMDIDDLLQSLGGVGQDVQQLSGQLKSTIARINQSQGLWKLLSDTSMARQLQRTAGNLEQTSIHAKAMSSDIRGLIAGVQSGEGNLGVLLKDTTMVLSIQKTLQQLEEVSVNANQLVQDLDRVALNVNQDIQQGDGTANLILRDTAAAGNISRSLENIEKGTAGFQENMEALKHNWFFRGYFKKQEKEKARQQKAAEKQ